MYLALLLAKFFLISLAGIPVILLRRLARIPLSFLIAY